MNLDKHRNADGELMSPDGRSYETPESFIQSHVLGFCGCGRPEANLLYIRSVLRHIDNLKSFVWEKKQTYEQWVEAGKSIFPNEGAEYFAFYFMAAKGLTEHGGSVPGWLTQEGIELLQDLDELAASLEETCKT